MASPSNEPEFEAGPSRGRFLFAGGLQFSGSVLVHVCGLAGGFIMARALSPEDFGALQGFRLVYVVAGFLSLGVTNGLIVRLAQARAAGDGERESEYIATAFWAYTGTQFLGALALVGLGVNYSDPSHWLFWAYLAAAISMLLMAVAAVADTVLWAKNQVVDRVRVSVSRAATEFLIKAVGVWFIGPLVLWLAEWGGHAVALPQARLQEVGSPRQVRLQSLRELVEVGFPLYIVSQVLALYRAGDRFMILAILGTRSLAIYGVANTLLNAALGVVDAFVQPWVVRAARMTEEGRYTEIREMTDDLATAVGWSTVLLGVLLGLVSLVVFEALLPAYRQSLWALMALAPLLCVRGISSSLGLVFSSHGWNGRLLPLISVQVVLMVALNLVALGANWGIAGVALMTSLGHLGGALCGNYLGWRLIGDSPVGAALRVARLYLPAGLIFLVAPASWFAAAWMGFEDPNSRHVAASGLVLVGFFPGVVLALRKAQVWNRARSLVEARGWRVPLWGMPIRPSSQEPDA